MSLKSICVILSFLVITPFTFGQYLLKIAPTQAILSNEIGLGFEHRIRSKISTEVQLGATYSKVLVPLESIFEKRFQHENPSRFGWGVYGALSMRYYLVGYNVAPAGFYLGTMYKYRLFHADFEDKIHTNSTSRGSNSQFVFQLVTGYQFPFTKVFSMDFFVGLGAAFQNEKVPSIEQQGGDFFWKTNKIKRTTFAPSIGIKLGFGKSGRELL